MQRGTGWFPSAAYVLQQARRNLYRAARTFPSKTAVLGQARTIGSGTSAWERSGCESWYVLTNRRLSTIVVKDPSTGVNIVRSRQFRDHFGIIRELFVDHSGIILVYVGIILKSVWHHLGIILGSFWDHCGIILETCLVSFSNFVHRPGPPYISIGS